MGWEIIGVGMWEGKFLYSETIGIWGRELLGCDFGGAGNVVGGNLGD